MAKEFYVEEDLCTACGDCWVALPKNFRDNGTGTAEVYDVNVVATEEKKLEQTMKTCPGQAILWKK